MFDEHEEKCLSGSSHEGMFGGTQRLQGAFIAFGARLARSNSCTFTQFHTVRGIYHWFLITSAPKHPTVPHIQFGKGWLG